MSSIGTQASASALSAQGANAGLLAMDREQHGDYWFVVDLITAGPQPLWQWKIYREPGGRIVAIDRADSEERARHAARAWIAGQS